jgi:two-component system KDP operon response regulator KdpE
MKPNPVALLIDADRPIRRLVRTLLEAHYFRVYEAENGQAGMKEAAARSPDVILLELALPDMDGVSVLHRIREWNDAPVLVLSGRGAESDKVQALDSGANDYVTKPFGSSELLARLRVLLRTRRAEPDGPVFANGGLMVDLSARSVTLRGRPIELTPTERAIFYTLVRHAGKLVTRQHLLRCVWGSASESKCHDLHVYIASLRRKLRDSSGDVLIQTEGSLGYRLLVPSADNIVDLPSAEPILALAARVPQRV